MKKNIVVFLLFLIAFCPFSVKAMSTDTAATNIKDYIESALKNNDWIVSDAKNSGYYNIKIKVGNTSDSKLKESMDNIKVANAKTYAIITDCQKDEDGTYMCDLDHYNYSVWFNLQEADSSGNVYLLAESIKMANYSGVINATKNYYKIVVKKTGLWSGSLSKDGTTTFSSSNMDDSSVNKTEGLESNPKVFSTDGSVTIPDKDDSFWDNFSSGVTKCYYIRFDLSSKGSDVVSARYKISPADLAQTNIFFANDARYTLGSTIVQDIKDDGYFGISHNNYYGICNTSSNEIYGKTFTFEFKDTKKLNVGNIIQRDEAIIQNGEDSVEYDSDGKSYPDYYDEDFDVLYEVGWTQEDGCLLLQKGLAEDGSTISVLQKILNYLRIAAVALLLVLGSMDFAGAIMSSKEDAMKSAGNKFVKRLMACMIVFLVPVLVNLILYVANKSESFCGLFGDTSAPIEASAEVEEEIIDIE